MTSDDPTRGPGGPRAGEGLGIRGPRTTEDIPVPYPEGVVELEEGPYDVVFARTLEERRQAQELRYAVFNVELDEGLASSEALGRDEDPFDVHCHHLLLRHRESGAVVGTYRLMTSQMAREGSGFYCEGEFDLSELPARMIDDSVELGRACIRKEHRNGTALFALWRGLASYLVWSRRRYFFGCCSLTSQDPREGWAMERRLEDKGLVHPEFRVHPHATHSCGPRPPRTLELEAIETPRLFQTYLRYGARSCGAPALDREFGTIDFFVVFDLETIPQRLRGLFFHGLEAPAPEFGRGS